MDITIEEVCDKLIELKTPTPKAYLFDGEYGQKDNRWWDVIGENQEGMSKQQYHVTTHFICIYYNGNGYPSRCRREYKCDVCYLNELYKCEEPENNVTLKKIYNNMGRPEMYVWLIEALTILEDGELHDCIEEIKSDWEKSENFSHATRMKSTREIMGKHITWDKIEKSLENLK